MQYCGYEGTPVRVQSAGAKQLIRKVSCTLSEAYKRSQISNFRPVGRNDFIIHEGVGEPSRCGYFSISDRSKPFAGLGVIDISVHLSSFKLPNHIIAPNMAGRQRHGLQSSVFFAANQTTG
jgi:hypothetical protein